MLVLGCGFIVYQRLGFRGWVVEFGCGVIERGDRRGRKRNHSTTKLHDDMSEAKPLAGP
jgi:hypothetical protein